MIPTQIQDKLNALARDTGETLYKKAVEVLSREPFINTGELAESLRISIIPARDDAAPEIVLEYADQGYFISYKSPKWTKVPNIEKLRQWAQTIDFAGPVPGYKNGAANLPPWKAKERIVSAIAWNKRKLDTWKVKPWKGRKGIDLGKLLRELREDEVVTWARKTETIVVQAIETGQILS